MQMCVPTSVNPLPYSLGNLGLSARDSDPRSGLGCKGIILRNTVGIIDSDYQGEVKLPIVNTSDKPFTIEPYMRIAQIGFFPVFQAAFEEVADFDVTTARGSDGFGSTGH